MSEGLNQVRPHFQVKTIYSTKRKKRKKGGKHYPRPILTMGIIFFESQFKYISSVLGNF